MNKKIVGIVAIIAGLLMLSGCGGEGTGVSLIGGTYTVTDVQVNGRTIPCVMTQNGGVSCDWTR